MRPTLFSFAGGEPAFLALARAHHARCLADPELNHPFTRPDQHPQHVERLAAYWAEVLGGRRGTRKPAATTPACCAMRAYTRWAVGDVLSHPTEESVPPGLRMPRWDWDGLVAP